MLYCRGIVDLLFSSYFLRTLFIVYPIIMRTLTNQPLINQELSMNLTTFHHGLIRFFFDGQNLRETWR
jgi:hypothetical protein